MKVPVNDPVPESATSVRTECDADTEEVTLSVTTVANDPESANDAVSAKDAVSVKDAVPRNWLADTIPFLLITRAIRSSSPEALTGIN